MAVPMEMLSNLQSPPLVIILIGLFICSWIYYHLCLSPGRNHRNSKSSSIPTNWPVVGMLPALFRNYHRFYDYWTEVLFESGGTFSFRGPWFCKSDMVFTCDPENYYYILSKNFSNYPKGPKFRKIFEVLGDGILNTDSELWKIHREVNLSILHQPDFLKVLQETVLKKLGEGLLPILETYANKGVNLDLQDVFQRFSYDVFTLLLLGDDPSSLSIDLPSIPTHLAFFDAEKALMRRHALPEFVWRLQKWAGFGLEGKFSKGWEAVDAYIYRCIGEKLESPTTPPKKEVGDQFNSLTSFVDGYKGISSNSNSSTFNSSVITKKFLRDVVLGLLVAGRDSTSTALTWFFFLLSKNPSIEAKIVQEIRDTVPAGKDHSLQWNQIMPKLVYLHAALCETLRLFPPLVFQLKAPVKPDVLPSGVCVESGKKVVMFFYSTGRMESVWGKDCMEFKPQRWITEQGKLRHVASYKFPAFNAGPRTCLGKDIAFVLTKMVAVSVICNYHVEVVQAHPVVPNKSVVIHMAHGLKVKLHKRI